MWAKPIYETSIQIATAAKTAPNSRFSLRALSGDRKKLAILSPTKVQTENATRLLKVKTVVIKMTDAKLLQPDGFRNCVNIKAMMT